MTTHALPYHAIALDLDGTLLDPQGQISSVTLRILRELSGRGIQIVIASGRMTPRVVPYANDLGIPMTLVTYNGAETLEGQAPNWKLQATRPISHQTRDAVFELCRQGSIFLNVYADGKLHGYHPDAKFAPSLIYGSQTGAEYAGLHDRLEALPQKGISKLLVVDTQENRDRLFQKWTPLLAGHCSLVKSNPEYLEFMALGVSKGSALESWLAMKGISNQKLIAFGDAENDLEMLNLAALGIAMGNASPGLRANWSRISSWTHAQDGVARELADLFGLTQMVAFPDPGNGNG